MPTPNFENRFDPYANWQAYAPEALGTPGVGFNPLTEYQGMGSLAEYMDVYDPYQNSDWINPLNYLRSLPQANANWDQAPGQMSPGGTTDGSSNTVANVPTGLLDDIQMSNLLGSEYSGGGQFGEYSWEPDWNLQTEYEGQGLTPWRSDERSAYGYNPAAEGLGATGGWSQAFNPGLQGGLRPSSDLFTSDYQFPMTNNPDWGADATLGLGEALGGFNVASTAPSGSAEPGCVLPGTKIETKRGEINIEDTKQDDLIRIYDFKTKKFGWSPIDVIFNDTVEEGWSELETASGKKLNCSNSHLMYHPEYKFNAVATDHLGVGGELYVINEDGEIEADTIVSIKVHDEPVEVWNYELELTHNYISNGILSHNAAAKAPQIQYPTSASFNADPTLANMLGSANTQGMPDYEPSFLNTGAYSDWSQMRMPSNAGLGVNAPYSMQPSMVDVRLGGNSSDVVSDSQQDKWSKYYGDYANMQAEGAGDMFREAATNPMLGIIGEVARGADASKVKQPLAWNALDVETTGTGGPAADDFTFLNRGQNIYSKPGTKDSLTDYIAQELPGMNATSRGAFANHMRAKMYNRANAMSDSDIGRRAPSAADASMHAAINQAKRTVTENPDLNPTLLKNQYIDDSIGQREVSALGNIQDMWNDPGDPDSLQAYELGQRKIAQDQEMAALKGFQDYRRDDVIGQPYGEATTLRGGVRQARDIFKPALKAIEDFYQGTGGVGLRGQRIDAYDDFINSRLYQQGPSSFEKQRNDLIDLYDDAIMGSPGGGGGVQANMEDSIQGVYENYLDSAGGGTTKESQARAPFEAAFDTQKYQYGERLGEEEYKYDEKTGELLDTRKESLSDAASDYKKDKRELDLQLQDVGDMSKLRRDIRGFVGGNILSGRRERRANEERTSALGARAELLNQQKDLTTKRREAQRKARQEYDTEQASLDLQTETNVEDLFGDAQEALSQSASGVSDTLSDYQQDLENEIYGDAGSKINTAYNQKRQMEIGQGNYGEQIQTVAGPEGVQGELTDSGGGLSNYANTYQDISEARTNALNQQYGSGGIKQTYESDLGDITNKAINDRTYAVGAGYGTGNALSQIGGKRNDYTSNVNTTGINPFIDNLRTTSEDLTGRYGRYGIGDMSNNAAKATPWYSDLSAAYSNPTTGMRQAIGGVHQTIGDDIALKAEAGPWGTGNSDIKPDWLPYAMLGTEKFDLPYGDWGKGRQLFGTEYHPFRWGKNVGEGIHTGTNQPRNALWLGYGGGSDYGTVSGMAGKKGGYNPKNTWEYPTIKTSDYGTPMTYSNPLSSYYFKRDIIGDY